MADLDTNSSLRQTLIDDAEYVAAELARGDAVPADVLVKAKPYIDPVMTALIAAKTAQSVGDPEYCKLQSAMVDLMTAIAPVTVGSLRDTETSCEVCKPIDVKTKVDSSQADDAASDKRRDKPSKKPKCVAGRFSNWLFVATIGFLLFAVILTAVVAAINDKFVTDIIKTLLPALYGGLGACVYLLRALHKHIHERTFDRRYQPEYWNRAVLGVVSGGVITVLAQALPKTDVLNGASASAIAFLIGYNTDLLFSLIERISNALFPKVPDPPVPDAAVMPAAPPKKPGDDDTPDGKPNGK